MDEAQEMDVGMDAERQESDLEPETAQDHTPEEALDLEEMPLFGDPEEGREEGETPEESHTQGRENQEQQGEAPQVVEIDGQQVPVETLVQAAAFGQQAAREVAELRERLEQYSVLDDFAKMAGMDPGTYIASLRGQLEQTRLQREAETMGVTPEVARQMKEAQRQQQAAQEALQRQQEAVMAEQQRRARIQPYMELIRRYPELSDPSKMPPEVAAQIQRGAHPVIAYQDYVLGQKQAAGRVEQQRRAVQAKSPGSAAGMGDGVIDEALAAFEAAMND